MATEAKISLKLLVNKNSRKVLFAEARKDFVDFLFGLLGLPLTSILGLLIERGKTTFGSLCSVYQSAKDIDNTYLLQNHQNKDFLFRPMPTSSSTIQTPLLKQFSFGSSSNFAAVSCLFGSSSNFAPPTPAVSCLFGGSSNFAPPTPAVSCLFGSSNNFAPPTPAVSSLFGSSSNFAPPTPPTSCLFGSSSSFDPTTPARPELDGYVKDVVTYMVMDDLVVKPMSTISSIALLNTFEVKDVGGLQEMTVEIDMEKGLELVQASFYSTTVLSDVFLPKNQYFKVSLDEPI